MLVKSRIVDIDDEVDELPLVAAFTDADDADIIIVDEDDEHTEVDMLDIVELTDLVGWLLLGIILMEVIE